MIRPVFCPFRRRAGFAALFLLVPPLAACDEDVTQPAEEGIGPAGGTVTLAGGAITLSVPAGALSSQVQFTATSTSGVPSADLLVTGSAHNIEPSGTTFSAPVTLTITYDPANLPEGTQEDELRPYKVVESSLQPIASSSVNSTSHKVLGQVTSLGTFGAWGFDVALVEVSPTSATLAPGEAVQLSAIPKAANGKALPSRPVVWQSWTPVYATVDASGLVTAVAEGVAHITASVGVWDPEKSGMAEITVEIPVASVEVTPPTGNLVIGQAFGLNATVRDAEGNVLYRTVTWTSSDDSVVTVVPVSAVGAYATVRGAGRGSAVITATSGGQSDNATFDSYEVLRILTDTLPLGVLGTPYSERLVATGGDGNYSWSGWGPDGFSVNPSTGVLGGTPVQWCRSFYASVTSGDGQKAQRSFSLNLRGWDLPAGPRAYVISFHGELVSVIDIASNRVATSVCLWHRPESITISPDGQRAYVPTNYWTGHETRSSISVIDLASNMLLPTIRGYAGGAIEEFAISPDGSRGYVPTATGHVSVIDLATNTVTNTFPVGKSPKAIAITPDGRRAYVTRSVQGWDSVSVIDLATNTVTATMPVGYDANDITITPDGSRAYVVNFWSHDVSVIDLATNAVTATIPVGKWPRASAIMPDGAKAYVTVNEPDYVAVIDLTSNTVTTTIPVESPKGIAITPDGTRAYVSGGGYKVSVIDLATNTVTATITVYPTHNHIAITPGAG